MLLKYNIKIRLTDKQAEKVAEILSNLGYIAFASGGLPSIIDEPDIYKSTTGFSIAILLWVASLLTLKNLEKNI